MKNKIIKKYIFKKFLIFNFKTLHIGNALFINIFILMIMCFSNINFVNAQSPELKKIKVKFDCTLDQFQIKTVKVEKYCEGARQSYDQNFVDRMSAPNVNWNGYCCIDNLHYYKNDIYKHTLSNGSVMYSESSSNTHFNKESTCEISFDTMDILKAIPKIGVSRVDPNLIEY